MIRTLFVDGPEESVIQLSMDDESLIWTCDVLPVMADVANAITHIELQAMGPSKGSPITIVYNAVAAAFAPGLEIVNESVEDLVY